MPKVGKKHYPYTHAGKRAAKEAAKKQGLKVEYTENTYERLAKLMFEVTKKKAQQTARSILANQTRLNKKAAGSQGLTDRDIKGAIKNVRQYWRNVNITDGPTDKESKNK